MNAREAGNYSVRTVGENILGVYIEGAEKISGLWGGLASQIGPAKCGLVGLSELDYNATRLYR